MWLKRARWARGRFRPRCVTTTLMCAVSLLGALPAATPTSGQASAEEEPAQDPISQTFRQFQELRTEFEKLGEWDKQAELITDTVDRYWEENEWNTEADQFARQAATEVAAIPPWNVTGRLNKMTELISERYQYDPAQRRRLESSVYSEMGWFLVKNRKVLWDQISEFTSMRSSGQAFTPELIARWTRESEPLLADLRERLDRTVESLEKTMTPQQREILKRDLESLERRQAWIDEMRRRWADGGWEPRDWGLEKDPAYANWKSNPQQLRLQQRRAARQAARERRALIEAVDETLWARYVRQFVRKYQLDEGQNRTAYSILRELQVRARDYKQSRRKEIEHLPRYKLATDPLGEPLKRMFAELKARLEPIPTAAQREAADGKVD